MHLFKLGALTIQVHPFNVDEVSHDAQTDYVAKPVVKTRPPLEYVGEGTESCTLSGSLFPKIIGGLDELSLLHDMRQSGRPQYLMRGDGKPLGWYVIEKVSEKSNHLSADGVGRKIRVSIQLTRAGKPSRLSLFSIIAGLLT